jgi:Cysteine-rich CPCC
MKIGTPKLDDPVPPSPEGIGYFVNMWGPSADGVFYHCPCCRYPTLPMRGGFVICRVCYWEDDGQDSHDAGRVRGGPNGTLSLSEARANFGAMGACEAAMQGCVRLPTDQEKKHRKYDA